MKPRHAAQQKHEPKRILKILLSVLLCAVLLFSYTPLGKAFWEILQDAAGLSHFTSELPADMLHIHVLNVGKADAILIESPGSAVLVDTGTKDTAQTVLRYLAARDIDQLDAVWISHSDSDHAGGLSEILSTVPAKAVYQSPYAAAVESTPAAQNVWAGATYTYDIFSLEILGPERTYNTENDNALVFRLTCGTFSMLFCGDIEAEVEEEMVLNGTELKADVLKVAHHGSNTSSSAEFLQAVDPDYAVISVGEDRNNLPRNAVLKRLYDADIPVFRTDTDGTVVFSTDGREIQITTEFNGLSDRD